MLDTNHVSIEDPSLLESGSLVFAFDRHRPLGLRTSRRRFGAYGVAPLPSTFLSVRCPDSSGHRASSTGALSRTPETSATGQRASAAGAWVVPVAAATALLGSPALPTCPEGPLAAGRVWDCQGWRLRSLPCPRAPRRGQGGGTGRKNPRPLPGLRALRR